ncbi:dTDP-glucose 4,6-dehydratase [soil metagenome]
MGTFHPSRLLITGGAGFIGSNLTRRVLAAGAIDAVVVLDALTYAGHLESLAEVSGDPRLTFIHGDICDRPLVERILREHAIDAVFHLAAESHVDRSIEAAEAFVRTNVTGTFTLLEAVRAGGQRFVHVSTDEVYGSRTDGAFTESSPYAPSSPYAASKAASDLLARSYFVTHGVPLIITNGCNTYGPYQLPEKLVPLMIANAIDDTPLLVYGEGAQRREWLHVDDHCAALWAAMTRGASGESYNLGSGEELPNLALVEQLADVVDAELRRPSGTTRALISFVPDRKGHDFRYALDSSRARSALGWQPAETLATQLAQTVRWYIANAAWRAAMRGQTLPPQTTTTRPKLPMQLMK